MTDITMKMLASFTWDVFKHSRAPYLGDNVPNTVGRLVRHTRKQILEKPNFGRVSYNRLRDEMAEYGLKLGMEWPERTIEFGQIDMINLTQELLSHARWRPDIEPRAEVFLPLTDEHPVYGRRLKARFRLDGLWRKQTVQVLFDPQNDLWCDADFGYNHYLAYTGYVRPEREIIATY